MRLERSPLILKHAALYIQSAAHEGTACSRVEQHSRALDLELTVDSCTDVLHLAIPLGSFTNLRDYVTG